MTRRDTAVLLSVLLLLLLLLAWPTGAVAWHDEGHVYAAVAAVEATPQKAVELEDGTRLEATPAFFREGAATVANLSLDPDVWRNRGTPQLDKGQDAEHFIDLEMLSDHPLPPTRPRYIELCHELGLDPHEVGFLPYAVAEHTGRLTLAFAEHRADPDNEVTRLKCLVYAGLLAHYAADLHQPLHTSVHYDGRVQLNMGTWGKSPRTGIHVRVDALPVTFAYSTIFADRTFQPTPRQDVFAYTLEELAASHALVERVYALEAGLPPAGEPILDPEVVAFTVDRVRASADFLATLYLTAWHDSATVRLPDWLDRPAFDGGFDRDHPIPQPPQP